MHIILPFIRDESKFEVEADEIDVICLRNSPKIDKFVTSMPKNDDEKALSFRDGG